MVICYEAYDDDDDDDEDGAFCVYDVIYAVALNKLRNVYEAIKGRRHYLPEAKTKHYMFEACLWLIETSCCWTWNTIRYY